MKIAIIGKGTSSIVTALTCMEHSHKVHIYYDPDSPHLSVGESTTPHLGYLIKRVLDVSIGNLLDQNIVSFKNGIKFINWGSGKDFRHHFQSNSSAFHFESGIFNPFMHDLLEKNGVVYHAKRVDDYKIIDDLIYLGDEYYDFIISCVGWDQSEEYYNPIFETVNTGILYREDEINDPSYTLHRATKHGWQFGLPFPQDNVTKCGYLFNSKIDDPQEVYKNLGKKDAKVISWIPRFSKRLVWNRHHAYNGNRLFFLEPLQALSVFYYIEFAKQICLFLDDPRHESYEEVNKNYLQRIFNYQISLAWHYSYGSIHDSDFWNKITEDANKILNLNSLYSIDSLTRQYIHDSKYKENFFLKIGPFEYLDFRDVHGGMMQMTHEEIVNSVPYY